ncbi:hypothetical protein TeGR_g1166 [Tetraparma gracilis]|uniref:Magnesium transporter n=1 Tax=Tetraparma gracilis TaxID=2962635 RepID=A0ABQ6N3Z4_9STRA|nr:hypothetical protein TeGR_g1166 [Tetraparma gracilis]
MSFYWVYLKASKVKEEFGPSHQNYAKFKKIHPLSCSALSGCLGAQSILCAKSVAEMIKESFKESGENQFAKPLSWVIVIFMVFFIFSQIHWLARGLESFDAVYIVPVFQCFFISVAVIGGAVYFREFDEMSDFNRIMFFFGLSILLVGVYLLSQRDMSKLKPRARFRAQVHVVVFMLRTQKAVRDKKLRHEQLVVEEAAEEAQKHSGGEKAPTQAAAKPAQVVPLDETPTKEPAENGSVDHVVEIVPGSTKSVESSPSNSPNTRRISDPTNGSAYTTPEPPGEKISPRERAERRSQEEDEEKKKAVAAVKSQLRRRSSVNPQLPAMEVAHMVDYRKKKVEKKITKAATKAANAGVDAITNKRRRSVQPSSVGSAGSSRSNSPRDLTGESPNSVESLTPRESAGEIVMNLNSPLESE